MSSTLLNAPQPDEILDRVTDCLTPEVAARIVAIQIDPRVQARVDVHAEKAAAGSLTDGERSEYEDLIEKADMLGIVKSLARRVRAA